MQDFKRWLYKGGRPNTLARLLNGFWGLVHATGVAPDYLVTLEVTGHRTGRAISFPLVLIVLDGDRFLIAMMGTESAWVRNVRAADGQAVLRHGRTEQVQLVEVPVEQRSRILKLYLQRAPGARPHIPVDKDAPVEAFDAIAAEYPVFRVAVVS
ncbi:MAG: nitroreductase family deazaflavin-dependent oxidoreductase [Anaerolineales bacterium]|nr:nitroreductase family deazaflavin-dependent oxidoreductase [Anaerolineales bacterium]